MFNTVVNYNRSTISDQLFSANFVPTEDTVSGFLQNFNGNFSAANPIDLQLVNDFYGEEITRKNQQKNSLLDSITTFTEQKNSLLDSIGTFTEQKNSLLDSITTFTEQKNSLLDSITTFTEEKNSLSDSITGYTNTFNTIKDNVDSIETQLSDKTNLLSNLTSQVTNRLSQQNVSLSDIRQKLDRFNQVATDLSQTLLQNPSVNLYASGSIKKLIPFKKKTKFFITLNGKEQWKTPLKASNITIKGLVSSRLATSSNTPEYNSAGKWRDVTKYFKPKLSNLSGRWCIELDNRKINDFPTGYWDEFVIRYDDPQAWSGEIIHWSWGQSTVTSAGDGDLMSGVADLRTAVEGVIAVLEDVTGEGAPNNTGNNSGVGGVSNSVTAVGTAVAGTTGSSAVNANIGNSGLIGEAGLIGES